MDCLSVYRPEINIFSSFVLTPKVRVRITGTSEGGIAAVPPPHIEFKCKGMDIEPLLREVFG